MCDQQCADQHNAEIDNTGLIVCESCPIEMPDIVEISIENFKRLCEKRMDKE